MSQLDRHIRFSATLLRRLALCPLLFSVVTACTLYRAQPLPADAALPAAVTARTVSASEPKNPTLDMVGAVAFALAHNPELRAQREQESIADAQLLSARLLPDPQISAGLDHPTSSQPDLVNAFSAGLSYELQALIARGAAIDAAKAGRAQARLDLIWQQWQVAQQVRSLYARCRYETQSLQLLDAVAMRLDQQYRAAHQALHNHDIDLNTANSDLAALTDVQNRRGQLAQQHIATEHDFNLTLGVAPATSVQLQTLPAPGAVDIARARAEVAKLPERRPDLLALRAGYASQEAKLRQAILEQYPGISVGISRARDTSAVYTSGFNIALRLPLFSGNRPAIALERATRARLYEEYRARLASSANTIDRLLQLQQQLEAQQRTLARQLPLLSSTAHNMDAAFLSADVDSRARNTAAVALLNAQLEQLDLERAGWENRIALETLLAWSPPPASLGPFRSGESR